MKITLEKNGEIKVVSEDGRVTVALTEYSIKRAVQELIATERNKAMNLPGYQSDSIATLHKVAQQGVAPLGFDNPVVIRVIKYAANWMCENPF
jgi:hypothetical protein